MKLRSSYILGIGNGQFKSGGRRRKTLPPQVSCCYKPPDYHCYRIMRHANTAICALLLLVFPPAASVGIASDESLSEREAVTCGPRSVFLLLSDLGISVSYDEVRSAISLSRDGSSIRELAECLSSYGVSCSARRLAPSDLLGSTFPLIAHVSRSSTGGREGHFLYVCSASPEGLDIIEPITGDRTPCWGWRSFSDSWSGVCLVPGGRRSFVCDPLFLLGMLNLCLIGMSLHMPSMPLRVNLPIGPRSSLVAAILILSYPVPTSADTTMPSRVLRSSARGGVNAALLMLMYVGGESAVSLDRIGREVATDMSLEEVHSLLIQNNCATELRKLTFAELSILTEPSIALLRFGEGAAGNFCLILDANESDVTLIRSGAMVVSVISMDDFRRHWTGHAVVSSGWNHKGLLTSPLSLFTFALGLIGGGAVGLFGKLRETAHGNTQG